MQAQPGWPPRRPMALIVPTAIRRRLAAITRTPPVTEAGGIADVQDTLISFDFVTCTGLCCARIRASSQNMVAGRHAYLQAQSEHRLHHSGPPVDGMPLRPRRRCSAASL